MSDVADRLLAKVDAARASQGTPAPSPSERRRAALERRDAGIAHAAQPDRIIGDDGPASIGATLDLLIHRYLHSHRTFFIDDFWEWAETETEWAALGLDPWKFIGAPMQRAQAQGWMEKVSVGPKSLQAFLARSSERSNMAPKWVFASRLHPALRPDPS